MKYMEEKGYVLGTTILYEHFIVPYVDSKRKARRYIIDFYCPNDLQAWEVKWSKKRTVKRNMQKAAAAVIELAKLGVRYTIVDERDFPNLTIKGVHKDPDVHFDKRSQRRVDRITRHKRERKKKK